MAAFIEPDVAGRRADQPRHRVALHVFGHVEPDHVVFRAEEEFGKFLNDVRLADTRRTEEQERSDRAFRVLDSGPRPADRAGDHVNGFTLANHLVVESVLHVQKPFALLDVEPLYRYARPHADHFSDVIGGDLNFVGGLGLFPLLAKFLDHRNLLEFLVPELGGDLVFLVGDGLIFLPSDVIEFSSGDPEGLRGHAVPDAHP